MPTNKLGSQAARLLAQAHKLHEAGRNAEAHELTMQAADCLDGAVNIEGFRLGANRKPSRAPKVVKPRASPGVSRRPIVTPR
jgi:hypothetical protein